MLPSSSNFSLDSFRAKAEQVCREEVKSNPQNVSALVNLGTLLKVKKEYAEAEVMFKRALEVDPKAVSALINLGSLMQNVKKDFVEAEALYRRALAVNPNDSRALIYLGSVLHFVKGQYGAAEGLYRKALESDHSSNSALMNLGGYLIRKTADESDSNGNRSLKDINGIGLNNTSQGLNSARNMLEKLKARAEASCRKELQSGYPTVSALVSLGAVLKCREDFSQAEDVLRKAINIDPTTSALLSLGSLLQSVKSDFEEAEALYNQAIRINPKEVRALIKLGALCWTQGREFEAMDLFQRAIDVDPSSIEIIQTELLNVGNKAQTPSGQNGTFDSSEMNGLGTGSHHDNGATPRHDDPAAFSTSMSSFVSTKELSSDAKISPVPPINTSSGPEHEVLDTDLTVSPSRGESAPVLQSNMGRIQSGKFFQIILSAGKAVARQNEQEIPGFLARFLAKKNWTKRASALVAKSKFSYFQTFVPRAAIHTLMASTMLTAQATTEKDLESHLKELVVLMVDISGFTRLSDRFQGLGQEGIDALTTTINNMFSIILDHVESWGGDVVKFAGDAVIVIWECPSADAMGQTLVQAIECARSLEKDHGAFQVNVPDVMKLAMADQLNRHFNSQVWLVDVGVDCRLFLPMPTNTRETHPSYCRSPCPVPRTTCSSARSWRTSRCAGLSAKCPGSSA